MLVWIRKTSRVSFVWAIVLALGFLLIMINGEPIEDNYQACGTERSGKRITVGTRRIKGRSVCMGCKDLENCTTVHGSVHLKGILLKNKDELAKQLRFPKLREITGHLIVTFLADVKSLSVILPNLSVIRGQVAHLYQDYALVVYLNDELRTLGLNSLTVVKQGGIKIGLNPKLCYLDRVRWESLINHGREGEKYELSIGGNSKDCYDEYCVGCRTPAGHGSSGLTYCWGGEKQNCQRLCQSKCGSRGCEADSQENCCHEECLGGCTKAGSSLHCNACQHFRLNSGKCVEECPSGLKEVFEFICLEKCPRRQYHFHRKCVDDCPAGYTKNSKTWQCDKCPVDKCPRVCSGSSELFRSSKFKINLLSDSAKLKGCTVLKGNLEIEMRNVPGGVNIAKVLSQDLGSIEEVRGYVVVRQSSSLISLNFFKNLKKIESKSGRGFSKRYALAIFDNPNLESLWDFHPNLKIVNNGVVVQLNPRLCLQNVYPLIDDVLKWNRTNTSETRLTISETTNGNARTCDVDLVTINVTETKPNFLCKSLCVMVSWPDKIKDRRNLLLYSIWYRETTHQNINEYDDIDACSSDHVWSRKDIYLDHNKKDLKKKANYISTNVGGLRAFTLYAFRVEAFVIARTGVKSAIAYFKTKQTKPSPPLALEVSFLSSHSLQVKWKKPFYPNGNITHYVIRYQESNSDQWNSNINWCKNQDSLDFRTVEKKKKPDIDDESDTLCAVNTTCVCEEDSRKELGPEVKAALFAKEFQDKIIGTVFVKKDDDDDDDEKEDKRVNVTTPTTRPTAMTSSQANESRTSSSQSTTMTPSLPRPPCDNDKNSSCGGTKQHLPVVFQKNTTGETIILTGLKYFTEYSIEVCACNSGAGCGTNMGFLKRECSDAVGRTDKNETADNVGDTLSVSADNSTKKFTLTWKAPVEPNGIVLRYDIWIQHGNETGKMSCVVSPKLEYGSKVVSFGRYRARVRAITPVGNGSWSNVVTFDITSSFIPGGRPRRDNIKLATIVGFSLAAILVLMIVSAVFLYFYVHKRYQKAKDTGVIYASVNPEYLNCSEVYVPDEWEIPREKITLLGELGNGSFGMVYEGEAKDIVPGEQCCRVAVKTVSENGSIRDKIEFLKEASIMKAFNSNHVVRLLGVVSDGQPVLVVMELMENGDLKSFLRKRRPDDTEESSLPPPTDHELFRMAAEIADGMAYLGDRKFVHRDLAARNCMVSSNCTCKIGDFGMARDVYETDYYRKGGKGFLPVRWMAPESLKDGIFATTSDVWSFGVVLWEMGTFAEQPYQGKSNEEVMKYVVDGLIMDVPETCPEILAELMLRCWQYKPKVRPSFISMVSSLEQYTSKEFVDRSFYHNQRSNEDVNSSCHSVTTEKEDLPEQAINLAVHPMNDPDTRESVV